MQPLVLTSVGRAIPAFDGLAVEVRRVPLPADSVRGGLMTQAAVLKVTANGNTTSPVVRGAWVAERLLGLPMPPPPSGVPAIEPDIRGAVTIREQLAKHRQVASCATCHTRIDPPGFALESFDVIGGWRENYRSRGLGEPVTIDGRRMHYARGLKVNSSDTLQDGRSFANIDEYKQLLLADDYDSIVQIAVDQVENGAHMLDVCVAMTERADEKAQMQALVKKLSQAVSVPLIFDTDMGNDVDDLMALILIHNLQRRGACARSIVSCAVTRRSVRPTVPPRAGDAGGP